MPAKKKTHLFSQTPAETDQLGVKVVQTQEEKKRLKMQDAVLQEALVNILMFTSPIATIAYVGYKLYRESDILTDKQRKELDANYENKIAKPWEKVKSFGLPPSTEKATEFFSAVGSFLKSATQFYTVDMGRFLKANPTIFVETLKETFKILSPLLNYVSQTLGSVFDKNEGPFKAFANVRNDFNELQKSFNKMFDFGLSKDKDTPEPKPSV